MGRDCTVDPESRAWWSAAEGRKASTRELVNAVLFFVRLGAAWRLLPHDPPPWQTVYYYLRRWQREGVRDWVYHA